MNKRPCSYLSAEMHAYKSKTKKQRVPVKKNIFRKVADTGVVMIVSPF